MHIWEDFQISLILELIFRQGSKNKEYLLHLYNIYKQFVLSPPAIYSIVDESSGKTRK